MELEPTIIGHTIRLSSTRCEEGMILKVLCHGSCMHIETLKLRGEAMISWYHAIIHLYTSNKKDFIKINFQWQTEQTKKCELFTAPCTVPSLHIIISSWKNISQPGLACTYMLGLLCGVVHSCIVL